MFDDARGRMASNQLADELLRAITPTMNRGFCSNLLDELFDAHDADELTRGGLFAGLVAVLSPEVVPRIQAYLTQWPGLLQDFDRWLDEVTQGAQVYSGRHEVTLTEGTFAGITAWREAMREPLIMLSASGQLHVGGQRVGLIQDPSVLLDHLIKVLPGTEGAEPMMTVVLENAASTGLFGRKKEAPQSTTPGSLGSEVDRFVFRRTVNRPGWHQDAA